MTRTLTRREPYATPLSMPSMRLFDEFFNDPFFRGGNGGLAEALEEGTLALDVSEDNDTVFVRASLPGFRREDIDVEIHDGVLSIKAEQSEEREETGERFYRRERRMGSVSRRVALPSAVMEDKTEASLKDGVLELRLPKSPTASPRKVNIK